MSPGAPSFVTNLVTVTTTTVGRHNGRRGEEAPRRRNGNRN
jgi:hypothetical protein